VSSREQEREGFSLDVQVDALNRYAEKCGGKVIEMFRIAETASKAAERTTFKDLMAYVKKNSRRLHGLLFYKVDRAARNLYDYVELERLEEDHGVPVIYVSQPTENTPAGKLQRRILANMASFYTEQQSLDVREGIERRVANGLPPQKPSYGYRNVRVEGRSLVEIDPEDGPKVQRIFDLYAYGGHTIDSIVEQLKKEGIEYRASRPDFPRSTIHKMLSDRAYIGDVRFRGQWYPGNYGSLIEQPTWDRVQVMLGEKAYRSYELTYSGGLIQCAYCGGSITGESKSKETKKGLREYVYYRCSTYNKPDHPPVRLSEKKLDKQVLDLFARLRVQDEEVHQWFVRQLREVVNKEQDESTDRISQLRRQVDVIRKQQDELLNLRLLGEIDSETLSRKNLELRDREAGLSLEIEACGRGRHENADIAVRAFELSQSVMDQWVTADYAAKRRYLEILVLNFSLVDVNLVPVWRKPFDMLAEGLSVQWSRGDWI
jgi:DNA invertase Pin-like site-specific DNA recombinase